jgi:hypothetical protein
MKNEIQNTERFISSSLIFSALLGFSFDVPRRD